MEGLSCADPGARTPIGASGNFLLFALGDDGPQHGRGHGGQGGGEGGEVVQGGHYPFVFTCS